MEIWKRFRKWGGMPTGATQNSKDLLTRQLNISPHQLSYVTQSVDGEGLLFYGNVILPFVDHFPQDNSLYKIMTTRPVEQAV